MTNRLQKIAQSGRSGPGLHVSNRAYGKAHIRYFLRDVIALANADVDGPRYIVVGTEADVPESDFSGQPPYAALASEYIEPAVRLRYEPVQVDGRQCGVFEIGACYDKPYMMRIDHCHNLRRGDAYVYDNRSLVRIGRSQLQAMFEQRFGSAVSAKTVEVGFAEEVIQKSLQISSIDIETLPSAVQRRKLQALIDVMTSSFGSGASSTMARLTNARLFGTSTLYRDMSVSELIDQLDAVGETHSDADAHALFEHHACRLQLVILNQGNAPLENASLSLTLPRHPSFFVADKLPRVPYNGRFEAPSSLQTEDYPPVSVLSDEIRVAVTLGDIPAGSPIMAFQAPLRICAGSALAGRRIGIRYVLSASNLSEAATGKLRLQI